MSDAISGLRVFHRAVEIELDCQQTFRRISADVAVAIWLDSATVDAVLADVITTDSGQKTDARWSILATSAGRYSEVLRYSLADGSTKVLTNDASGKPCVETLPADILTVLRARLVREPFANIPSQVPFKGGYLGYLGYETKALILGSHAHNSPHPDAYWLRPQSTVVYDHQNKVVHLVVLAPDEISAHRAFDDVTEKLIAVGTFHARQPVKSAVEKVAGKWRLSLSGYEKCVKDAKETLAQGESFEVCVTDTWQAHIHNFDGLSTYAALRQANPAPYAAYASFKDFDDDIEILCSSPENFLAVADGKVQTKPIKGTAPRSPDATQDAELARELVENPKTRAENVMIVDLLRNDLSRVCRSGSVVVPKLMAIESYPSVHQLVTTVTGQLRDDMDLIDLLRVTFPGGSMTGAPKLSTLGIIDRLETGPRGIYSGIIGYLSYGNRAQLAMVIRTIVKNHDDVSIGAGGAVVWDSDPAAEYDEKELKAAALLEVLGARDESN